MANKGRVLVMLRFLQQCSDEDHPVTTAEIRKELADKGCPATVETVRDDISMIRECGFDVVVNETSGQSTTYSYVDRDFSATELQILIDHVWQSHSQSAMALDKDHLSSTSQEGRDRCCKHFQGHLVVSQQI